MYQSKNKSVGIWLCIRIELMQQLKCENKVNFSDEYPTIVTAQLQPKMKLVWPHNQVKLLRHFQSSILACNLILTQLKNIQKNLDDKKRK